jgi:hypothetical protein
VLRALDPRSLLPTAAGGGRREGWVLKSAPAPPPLEQEEGRAARPGSTRAGGRREGLGVGIRRRRRWKTREGGVVPPLPDPCAALLLKEKEREGNGSSAVTCRDVAPKESLRVGLA